MYSIFIDLDFKTLKVEFDKAYKEKYLKYAHPEYIKCVSDITNKLIAFVIIMPSFTKALKKANGKLFPFGVFHLLKAKLLK